MAKAEIEFWQASKLTRNPNNPRQHSEAQVEQIAASIASFGFTIPILADPSGTIIAGHGRDLAAALIYQRGGTIRFVSGKAIPKGCVPVIVARGWSAEQRRAYTIADNRLTELGEWNQELLKVELSALKLAGFDATLTGFDSEALERILSGGGSEAGLPVGNLGERFGIPPFSVFNAREGWWQDRKRAWIALGIQSELGRGENLIGRSPQELFCHLTGTPYDKARKIVSEAMVREGETFDLMALVRKHGGRRRFNAVPGGGVNATENAKLPLDRKNFDFSKSGAVVKPGGKGGMVAGLRKLRGYSDKPGGQRNV